MSKEDVLKIKRLNPEGKLPSRATLGSAGLDLYACLGGDQDLEIGLSPVLVPTGIAIELPSGYEVQIRPRSGLSSKGGMAAFGTVDSDYRGELKVTMYLLDGDSQYIVKHGDRIAQMVISQTVNMETMEVQCLSSTDRGSGGHGSTGT